MSCVRFVLITCVSCIAAGSAVAQSAHVEKLPWGAANYGFDAAGVATELDKARWDWVSCGTPGPDACRELNRLLTLNPNHKYHFQVSGGFEQLGRPENASVMNFLDYHFDAKRREALRFALREEVAGVLKRLEKPEKVVAFTFREELPGWWGHWQELVPGAYKATGVDQPRSTEKKDPKERYPRFLKPYQQEIEQERGKALVWNEETWRYLGKMFVETLDDVHKTIKTASGGKPVYFWLHPGFTLLDDRPKDWTFETSERTGSYCSFRYEDIIHPGYCDGIMIYLKTEDVWKQRWKPLLEKYNWPYFSQLSYPAGMRLASWEVNCKMAIDNNRWNQGYFYFGQVNTDPHPLNDPEMPAIDAAIKDRFVTPFHDPQEGWVVRIAPNMAPSVYTHVFQSLDGKHQPQPGKRYRWSVRVKTRDVTDRTPDAPKIPLTGRDQGAVVLVAWWSIYGGQILQDYVVRLVGTHEWQTYNGVVTAPAGTGSALIFVGMRQATGEAFFDKLSFKPEGDNAEWIVNGDFEKFTKTPLKIDGFYLDDPSVGQAFSRYFCNKFHIGDDVVARYFKLAIALEKPAVPITSGQPFQISARLTNTRDTRYYGEVEAATAKDVEAILELPPGLKLVGGPQTKKTSLAAGRDAVWQWSVVADKPGDYAILRTKQKSQHAWSDRGDIHFGISDAMMSGAIP